MSTKKIRFNLLFQNNLKSTKKKKNKNQSKKNEVTEFKKELEIKGKNHFRNEG